MSKKSKVFFFKRVNPIEERCPVVVVFENRLVVVELRLGEVELVLIVKLSIENEVKRYSSDDHWDLNKVEVDFDS